MSSTYGDFLKLSIFGQSHGPAIGMTLDGIPAGLRLQEDQQEFHPESCRWQDHGTDRK